MLLSHPHIIHSEPFTPHAYEALVAMRAFPEGSMPEPAYQRFCEQYNALEAVNIQRITYQHEGLNITGITAFPTHSPPKGLVIYNRGGSGNYGILTVHALLRQFAPLAAAGYAVVGSNYRGNDGGDGQDEFGGRDVDDVIALHDIARASPALASLPCFVIGHSRGGMMSYLLMKRGLKMQACVAIASVSDLQESSLLRPEMRERVYKRFIPNFEANEAEALAERSAICWPEKLTAPLLLLHGTKDEAVPHSQSEALAKMLPHTHELVLYEGGNHALTRHWDDVMKRTLAWIETHDA